MTIKEIMDLFENSKNVEFLKEDINKNRFINLDLFIEYIKKQYNNRLDSLLEMLEDYYKYYE